MPSPESAVPGSEFGVRSAECGTPDSQSRRANRLDRATIEGARVAYASFFLILVLPGGVCPWPGGASGRGRRSRLLGKDEARNSKQLLSGCGDHVWRSRSRGPHTPIPPCSSSASATAGHSALVPRPARTFLDQSGGNPSGRRPLRPADTDPTLGVYPNVYPDGRRPMDASP